MGCGLELQRGLRSFWLWSRQRQHIVDGPLGNIATLSDTETATQRPSGAGWHSISSNSFCVSEQCLDCWTAAGQNCGSPSPDAPYSNWTNYQKTSPPKIVDLGGAADNGDITITITPSWQGTSVSDPVGLYLGITATRFVMTETPSVFRPRDSRDTAADCGNHTGDCYPTFHVWLFSYLRFFALPLDNLSATFQFKLEHPAGIQSWLPGTSTNFGSDTSADPDYIFEQSMNPNFDPPTDQGLKIALTQPVDPAQGTTVTVSSHDFGGTANLRAVATIQGHQYEAAIIDPNTYQQVAPPACAGTGNFASLPVDTDCDSIADSWEDQNSSAPDSTGNLAHLPPDWDKEPGYLATSPMGDGYSVSDEYRGFHYVSDDLSTTSWTSTDPLAQFDVFFWDGPSASGNNSFTQALRSVLANQGSDRYVYWRVTPQQANAHYPNSPSTGAGRLNVNSTTAQPAFAVVYASRHLNGPSGYTPGAPRVGGLILGWTPHTLNDGSALYIDTDAITAISQFANFPQSTLIAEVVAHETGHHFGQRHPLRQGCCSYFSVENLTDLTLTQFTFRASQSDTSSKVVHIRLSRYSLSGNSFWGDSIDLSPESLHVTSQTVAADSQNPTPVARLHLDRLLSQTDVVGAQVQQLEIMDWAPNFNLTDPSQWHFDPANLNALCVRTPCQR